MKVMTRNLLLGAAAVAATAFFTTGSGLPIGLGAAFAAPLAPPAGFEMDSSAVILAKDKGLKCCGNGGGNGGKGSKGGSHNHHWGPIVGGAIVLGLAHCTVQSERCEEEYGEDTGRYWRCMRRAGCSD